MEENLAQISKLLDSDEILLPGSPKYADESQTWAAHKNLNPKVVARPNSLDSLCRLVAYLGKTDLDCGVRSGGIGSASAKDILISMTAFDSFECNLADETATFGAGQTWHEVDEKVDRFAPGYATPSARVSFVGVGGSIALGGLSWMSSEVGIACDPGNMLDVEIVKADGSAVWASTEPDLLWALRGGGGSFGIITTIKARMHKYPHSIFSGRVVYPRSALQTIAKRVADFTRRTEDPKMCMHLYCLSMDLGVGERVEGEAPGASIAISFYDANGEEHGRSAEGFEWALSVPGATEMSSPSLSYREVNAMFDDAKVAVGAANSHTSAPLVSVIDEDLVLNAWSWYENLLIAEPLLAKTPVGTFVVIELMQKAALYSDTPRLDAAWPKTRAQHVVQLGVAAPIGYPEVEKVALKALQDAPQQICGNHNPADFLPNYLQPWNETKLEVYGPNFEKLVELKRKYDPRGLFKGPIQIPGDGGAQTT